MGKKRTTITRKGIPKMSEYCKNCFELAEKLAEKEQEYNALLEQHKELDDRINRMIEEKYNLGRECEELKGKLRKLELENTTLQNRNQLLDSAITENYILEEKYEALKLGNEEGYEIVDELKRECEELKNLIFNWEQINKVQEVDIDRYRKALEEIEKVINNILNSCLGRNTVGCRPVHNVCENLIKILNIINKVKGKSNG